MGRWPAERYRGAWWLALAAGACVLATSAERSRLYDGLPTHDVLLLDGIVSVEGEVVESHVEGAGPRLWDELEGRNLSEIVALIDPVG